MVGEEVVAPWAMGHDEITWVSCHDYSGNLEFPMIWEGNGLGSQDLVA